MEAARCDATIYPGRGDGRPRPAASPDRYRLVFVPGFLSECLPGFNAFDDAIEAARAAGFDAVRFTIGGRSTVAENADRLATQFASLPDDGRDVIVFGHSKGAVDALEVLVSHPEAGRHIVAVVGIAASFGGSPLAEGLGGLYRRVVSSSSLLRCASGGGEELAGLEPSARRDWWRDHRADLPVPVYAIVAVPQSERVSPVLGPLHARLGRIDPANDGLQLAPDEMAPGGTLLAIVNSDHLEAAIARPQRWPWSMLLAFADVPRADIVLAALDVVAADLVGESPGAWPALGR
jgi:hypothetical protein